MHPIIIQEAVVAEWNGYAEKVLDKVSYQEARQFCEDNHWRMMLHGRECFLKIIREDQQFNEFPAYIKVND